MHTAHGNMVTAHLYLATMYKPICDESLSLLVRTMHPCGLQRAKCKLSPRRVPRKHICSHAPDSMHSSRTLERALLGARGVIRNVDEHLERASFD